MSAIANLEELCPHDGRTIGDHTMREWSAHLDAGPHTDLGYEENPDGPMAMNVDGAPVCDSLTARSSTLKMQSGTATVLVPAMVIDWEIGTPDAPPRLVQRIVFVSGPDVMRKAGKLLRDTANGAANAAERGGGR